MTVAVNIKDDYGAVGDGQIATVHASFTDGSNSLTVFSNIFNSGDIGKYIAVTGWLLPPGSPGANPQGVQAGLGSYGTLDSISSAWDGTSMTVVLGGPAAARTVSNVSTPIEWGTDDTPAFRDFNADQADQPDVELTIPDGRYLFVTGEHVGSNRGIEIGITMANFKAIGVGGPTLSDLLGGGSGFTTGINGAALFNDNTHEALVQTVSAGATVLQLITPSDTSLFTVGEWAWLAGYDTEGFGNPPNPKWAEFVKVVAIDAVAGTVTINSPLKYSYKSTWPRWDSGSPSIFSQGGPATLYAIQSDRWDQDQTWDGVNVAFTPTVGNGNPRSLTIKNAMYESFGPNISFQRDVVCDNIVVPFQWELDKGTENFTLTNSHVRGFKIFSPWPFNVLLDTVTIDNQFPGTSANWIIRNCNVPDQAQMSPSSYGGASDSIEFTNNAFAGDFASTIGVVETDDTSVWSISNGLMSRPKSGGALGAPPQFCTPGSYFTFKSRYNAINPVWRCLDIYESAGVLYLQTDQAVSEFPPAVDGVVGDPIGIVAIVPRLVAYSGNSGSDDAVGWLGDRLFQHWLKTYNGNIGSTNAARAIKVWGQFVKIKVTVHAGYTAGTLGLSDPFFYVLEKPSNARAEWSLSFDLTQPGTRTIDVVAGVSGALGSDSLPDPPNSGDIWLVDDQIVPFMSGAVGAGSVTIEIEADQGFPAAPAAPTVVAPLRLRLAA